MTKNKALKIAQALKGKTINNWTIGDYINNGKSALVCKCSRGTKVYAIKIYDDDLIEEFGESDIKMRIERQLQFIKKRHTNLIKIYGGGYCPESEKYYLIMEYLEQKNLSEVIKTLPRKRLIPLIKQLVKAVCFLENHRTYHRDIKPDNISISKNYSKITLLDLGVIKPIKFTHGSSSYPKNFVGTLQYSPKEFLLGEVKDTSEGWRAVTFYQIGAVIYDLIERKQIFEEYKIPWGKLSKAVLDVDPEFISNDIPLALRHICIKCLNKDPNYRINNINWNAFLDLGKIESLKQIKKRIEERKQIPRKEKETFIQIEKLLTSIENEIDEVLPDICNVNNTVPPYERLRKRDKNYIEKTLLFEKNVKYALSLPFAVIIKLIAKDTNKELIEIRVSSFLANEYNLSNYYEPNFVLHLGNFNKNSFKISFEKYFFAVFDIAQSTTIINNKIEEIKINL